MTPKTKPTTAQRSRRAAAAQLNSPTPSAPAGAARSPGATSEPKGKLGVLVGLLRRPEGASVHALAAATGWQVHSVRGAIAGALKKDRGLNVVSIKTEAGRIYRIAEAQP